MMRRYRHRGGASRIANRGLRRVPHGGLCAISEQIERGLRGHVASENQTVSQSRLKAAQNRANRQVRTLRTLDIGQHSVGCL
jgi:hypothetical protein